MGQPVFLALADDADQRRVAAGAGHEVRVGVGAVVQQRAGNRHGVVVRRGEWEPRVAEKQQRLPAFGAELPVEVALVAGTGAIGAARRALF